MEKFGKLTFVSDTEGKDNHRWWLCLCDCGSVKSYRRSLVLRGKTRSCGCGKREQAIKNRTTHGHCPDGNPTPEYRSYRAMLGRCYNPNSHKYQRYGGRGITVCDRWRESFQNFVDDMGLKPSDDLSIDRINNDGNYEPENCRWATASQQRMNTSKKAPTHEFNGQNLTLIQISNITGISVSNIKARVRRGVPLHEAATRIPVWRGHKK